MTAIMTARLTPDPQRFPPGTAVSAYRASAWSSSDRSVAPTGPADAGPVNVAVDGTLTFSGLTDQTTYFAWAAGAGAPVRFTTRHDYADDLSPWEATNVISATAMGISTAVGVVDNCAALQAAIQRAQDLSRPLELDVQGTLLLTRANQGGLKIDPDRGPLTIIGPGEHLLTIRLSRGCPRLFDLDAGGAQNKTFRNIDVGGFTLDAGVAYTDLAPLTTITAPVTLPGTFAYTTVTLASNAAFQDSVDTIYLPASNADGTAHILAARPVAGSATDIQISSNVAINLVAGDQVAGAFISDHALIGNRHGTRLHSAANGTQLVTFFKDIHLHDINVINLPALQTAGGLNAPSPSRRFGVAINLAAAGSTAQNITYDRVRINGGDCGTWTVGVAGTWIDNVTHIDCFHDRGSVATANYSSLNFMVGGQAWGGRAAFRGHNHGLNSGDVGIEVDNFMFVDIGRETLIEDAFSANFYGTNFVAPARSVAGPSMTTVGAGGIDNVATTLPITAIPSSVDQEGYLLVGTEVMHYDAISTTSARVRRGINGSVAAAHNAGDTITFLEVRRQRWNFEGRSRRINCVSGSGVKMLTNSSLPLPALRVRGSHERINDTAIQGEAVYIDGLCPELDVDDGYRAIVAGAATQVGSMFFLNRSGATGSTGVHDVAPDLVHIGDVTMRGSGSTTSSFTYVRVEAGHWDLDITDLKLQHGIRPSAAGQTRGVSSGAVTNSVKATIKMAVFSTDNSDGAFQPVRLDGNTSLTRADLDLDLFAMYVSTSAGNPNYVPFAAAVNVTRIRRIVHPFQISAAVTSPYPTRPKPVKKVSANYTATHDDEILVLDAVNATGPFTVTLPPTSGGSATSSPRPGDGSAIQLIFIGDTTTNRITVQPTAGEKLLGTTNGTVVISQAGSGRRDYIGTNADGWW